MLRLIFLSHIDAHADPDEFYTYSHLLNPYFPLITSRHTISLNVHAQLISLPLQAAAPLVPKQEQWTAPASRTEPPSSPSRRVFAVETDRQHCHSGAYLVV